MPDQTPSQQPEIIDIGANLADQVFRDDLDEVLQRAREAGLTRIVVTGSDDASNRRARSLAEADPGFLWATAGVHPHHAAKFNEESAELIRSCASSKAVRAVGECGLDYFRDIAPRAQQIRAFETQLDIASDLAMPVFLHQRDSIDDFVHVIKNDRRIWPRAVAHCFTDELPALRKLLDLDLYIGITGWICDERRGQHLLDIVRYIPADRLMIETDAPYLMPRNIRPKPKSRRNEPALLGAVLGALADARKVSRNELAKTTSETANAFFAP